MTDNASFSAAREQQHAWKSEQVQCAAKELVLAGVALHDAGTRYFGPDDIPDAVSFPGCGIVGAAVHMLLESGVIVEFFGDVMAEKIRHGRRASKRASANGRKVSLYSLTSRPLAQAYLARHGVNVEVKRQMEMAGI
jgi:hypothetical protein